MTSVVAQDGALTAVEARMTGAGVDVLAPRSVEPLRTDTVRHAAPLRSRPTNSSVEAGSSRAPGAQPGLADGAAVAGWTEALERTIAGVQAEPAVSTWPTVTGVSLIFTSVSSESRIT